MKVGRNDPCPCGSGKKYKHCCLAGSAQASQAPQNVIWRRLRRVLEGHPKRLAAFTQDVYGLTAFEEAWAEFRCWETDEDTFNEESPLAAPFLLWCFHCWAPDVETKIQDESLRGQSPTAEFLRRRGQRLDPLYRRYLEACLEAPFSVHEILTVEHDRGFRAREVLTGQERDVSDSFATEFMQPGDLLYGQLVDIECITLLEGWSPVVLPPKDKIEIIELRRRVMPAQSLGSPAERLRDWDMEIRDTYLELGEDVLYGDAPEDYEAEGKPLFPASSLYEIDSAQIAFDALKQLSGLPEGELLDEAARGRDGEILSATIDWDPRGENEETEGVVALLTINRQSLIGHFDSAEHAVQFRQIVQDLLGSRARHITTRTEETENSIAEDDRYDGEGFARDEDSDLFLDEDANAAIGGAEPEDSAVVAAALRRLVEKEYEEWTTTPLLELEGRTPAQAIADPEGREMVEALVLQIERDVDSGGLPLDPAFPQRVREQLGFAPEPETAK